MTDGRRSGLRLALQLWPPNACMMCGDERAAARFACMGASRCDVRGVCLGCITIHCAAAHPSEERLALMERGSEP